MSEETVPQMRDQIKALEKDLRAERDTNAGLKTQLRVRDARDVFRDQGFNPKHGDLYAAVNPDGEITAESVVAFADEQSLNPISATSENAEEVDSADATAEAEKDLSVMAGGGSSGGDGGAGGANVQSLTRPEWVELSRSDPAAARAAAASGRVQLNKGNPYAPNHGPVAGGNPYVPATSDS